MSSTSSTLDMPSEPRQWSNKKRIILCADGTWEASDQGDKSHPSNVAKIARAIATTGREKDPKTGNNIELKQVVFYQSGLGSGDLPLQRFVAGSFGWGLEDDVCQIYEFISNNYDSGDELFFFGFSRGAYTVRSVAGLVSDVGVLSADQMSSFPGLWEAYRKNTGGKAFTDTDWYKDPKNRGKLRKEDVTIKVVGVWDTVGALGIPEWRLVQWAETVGFSVNKKYRFHNTRLSNNIEYAFQALALDERRFAFPPALWFKRDGGGPRKALSQCWFPGVHGNIGGSCEEPIGANTFAWMAIGDKLTFEKSVIDKFVADYKELCGKTEVPWGCWSIDNRWEPLKLLGEKHRTPGEYKDRAVDEKNPSAPASDTQETFHSMVRWRKDQLDKWRPGSLADFIERPDSAHKWWWLKDNVKDIPEDSTISVTGDTMVVAYPQNGTVGYEDRGSLSRELCPEDIRAKLEHPT
ncbi:hypothetical protein BDW71DRAFT_211952 [Aspergillus fruticulosus]